ncbi:MAG: 50S ribosomal protein L29 [Planctomycetota bacterium]|jgi:large subunit ribosomal protein L29
MEMQELRGKDSRELHLDIQELLKEQFQLRFKAANEEVANTARFRQIRRQVARIRTVLQQRESEARAQAASAAGSESKQTEA